jgi:alkanesulfonate monooxygenase
MRLRFHWSMSSAGESLRGAKARASQSGVPDMSAHLEFCRQAEQCGIESLLTAFGFHRPDPIALATALGVQTSRIKFMVAVRSGIFSPTVLVQQVNTVSALTNGRICLNIVAGHTPNEQRYYGDFLTHDERYERTDEFLAICRSFWSDERVTFAGKYYKIEDGRLNIPFVAPGRSSPEIFLGGNSPLAEDLAIKHAHCLWRLPDTPERLRERVQRLVNTGTEVGLLVSIVARPTREEALIKAHSMVEALGGSSRQTHRDFEARSDSVAFTSTYRLAEQTESNWLTPYLWTGAVPYLGAPSIALVGSAGEIADAILEYKSIGITQFLFMGWPDIEEMGYFSKMVLPIIRSREDRANRESTAA